MTQVATQPRWRYYALAIAGIVVVLGFLGPWGPRMLDLSVYRTGASALLHGQDLYQVREAASGLPFTYPVFAALVFTPFAVLPWWAARTLMLAVSLLALYLVCRLTLRELAGPIRWALPVTLGAVLLHPVMDTLMFGQINLVLLAIIMWDTLASGHRSRGILVGIAAGIKLTPALFIVYFLVTGQRRAAVNAVAAFGGTVLIGLILQPGAAWVYWTHHITDPGRTGNVIYPGNQSILATVSRLLRDTTPSPVVVLGLSAVCVIVSIVVARVLYRRSEVLASVCVVGVALLLVSPISWTHHWVWCIPVFGVLFAHFRDLGARIALAVAALVIAAGITRFAPANEGRELSHTMVQQLVANSFTILAVGFLAWSCVYAYRLSKRTEEFQDRGQLIPGRDEL